MLSPVSTPPCTPPRAATSAPKPLNDKVEQALQKALPGINARALIHSLDVLLGGRDNYTIVGSASMHLQAIEYPNPSCELPLPNDIDVVANDTQVMSMSLLKEDQLAKLDLKRDKNFALVFYMKRNGHPDLKIDIVSSKTPGFMKYRSSPQFIHGLNVGRITDTLNDYQNRVVDAEFIGQCGGMEQAREKINPWLKYFDRVASAGQATPAAPSVRRQESSSSGSDRGETPSSAPTERRGVAKRLTF